MQLRAVWRAFKTPLTLVFLLVFMLVIGAWAYQAATAPVPDPPPVPCATQSVGPTFTADNAWIGIYNGTDRSGLARTTKLLFGNAGFHVVRAINADGPVEKTYVAGASADSPEVQLVMSYFPKGTPFQADPVKYADHVVDIYLGKNFDSKKLNSKPLQSVALPSGTACLPQLSTTNTET